MSRASQRNSNSRANFKFGALNFSRKCCRAGGGGVCLKKFSEHFQKFQKIFPDKDQLNFFGPIPVKLIGLKNFLMPVFILFILFFNNKNVPNIFFNYTFYGSPFGTFFNWEPEANFPLCLPWICLANRSLDLPQVGLERNASSKRERRRSRPRTKREQLARSRSRENDLSYLQRAKFYWPKNGSV
jgi:hypothetical protein